MTVYLRTRSEEIEKHNSTLKADLEKASQREEDLKTMHNNYMSGPELD
ncbi:hypothetical protein [Methanosarcina sp. UBA5]|nr:hypothetical protein [Methanosarcina sp. UBA5]